MGAVGTGNGLVLVRLDARLGAFLRLRVRLRRLLRGSGTASQALGCVVTCLGKVMVELGLGPALGSGAGLRGGLQRHDGWGKWVRGSDSKV